MQRPITLLIVIISLLLTSCQEITPPVGQEIQVTISVDGSKTDIKIPANSSVQNALAKAGFLLGTLDRIDPPLAAIVTNGELITITRVVEEYYDKNEVIPYDHQNIKERIPSGR